MHFFWNPMSGSDKLIKTLYVNLILTIFLNSSEK